MLIPPNQAGVALGLFAFSMASLVSIFSDVTLEIAILRGGIAFLVFWVLGWLMAYLLYEEEKPETGTKEIAEEETGAPVETTATTAEPEAAMATEGGATVETDAHDLEAPDDSDF